MVSSGARKNFCSFPFRSFQTRAGRSVGHVAVMLLLSCFPLGSVAEVTFVAAGVGANSLAFSNSFNATEWTGLGLSIFSSGGYGVGYSAELDMFVAAGSGAVNTLGYSLDGVTWVGVGKTVFATIAYCAAFGNDKWVAGGSGGNSLAFSYDGIVWQGVGSAGLSAGAFVVAYGNGR